MSTLFNIQVHKGQPGSVSVKYVDPATGARDLLGSEARIIMPGGEGTFVVHADGSVLIERVQTPGLAKPAAVIPPGEVPAMDSAPEAEPSKEE